MNVHRNLSIPGSRKRPIVFDLFLPETKPARGILIFSHGFKGFKDWGTFDLMAQYFTENGYAYLKFNFSYNGTRPADLLNFCDLDAFGQNTYSIELNDLGLVIDWAADPAQAARYSYPAEKLYIMGHSRGGGITLLKCSEDPRVKKAITLASVSDLGRGFNEEQIKEWKRTGVQYVLNGRTGQQMPLYLSLYGDYSTNADRLELSKRIPKIGVPVLVIHGTEDEAVPFESANEIASQNSNCHVFKIDGANHVFGGGHPWLEDGLPSHLKIALDKTLSFLNEE